MLFRKKKKASKLSRALGLIAVGAVAADVIGGLAALAKIRKVTTDPDTAQAPAPEDAVSAGHSQEQ